MIILSMLFRKVSKILDLVGSTGVDAPGICGNGMVMMMLVLYRWIFRAEFGMNTSGDCTWCRCCTVAEAQLQGLQWSQRSAVGGKFKRHRKQGVELEKRSFWSYFDCQDFPMNNSRHVLIFCYVETHLDPSVVTGRRSHNANAVPLGLPNPHGEGWGHSLYSSQHRHVICKIVKPYYTKMLESLVFWWIALCTSVWLFEMLWSERIWMALSISIKSKVEFMECLGLCWGMLKDPQPSLRSICLHTCLVTCQYSLSAAVGSTAWFWEYRSWHCTASIQVEVKFIFQTCWIPGAKKSNPLHCRKTSQSGSQQPQPALPPLPQLQQLPRLPQVPLQHSTSTPQTALWRPTGICRGRCL